MNIAIDYDCTLYPHVSLWTTFIRNAIRMGHEVRIVTWRHADNRSDDIDTVAASLGIDIIFCGHRQKAEVCRLVGWEPDIWIDDKPVRIPTYRQLRQKMEQLNEV